MPSTRPAFGLRLWSCATTAAAVRALARIALAGTTPRPPLPEPVPEPAPTQVMVAPCRPSPWLSRVGPVVAT